jgi:Uma2 family endonuclease
LLHSKIVWTDEEFMALPDDAVHYELVDGEVVNLGNSGMEHGNISVEIHTFLVEYFDNGCRQALVINPNRAIARLKDRTPTPFHTTRT